jgi:hypothetical protein
MSSYRAGNVCLSVCMIKLENWWTDFDEIWYGRYAVGGYRFLILFNFLQSIIPTWQTNELVRLERH